MICEGGREEAGPIEFRRLRPELAEEFERFFQTINNPEDLSFFHPHAFTPEKARELCEYTGRDLYYVAYDGSAILAYGMLCGWDEGYEIPSLGIALHPAARGRGLARTFMLFLHLAAKWRGASKVRLTVFKDNVPAVRLYTGLGYLYQEKNDQEYVGFIDL